MWFHSNKNRRNERSHLLDVKLRSQGSHGAGSRLLGLSLAGATLVMLCGFLVWKGWGYTLDRLIYSNPALTVQQIVVVTDGVLPVDLIQRWAGVKNGENLMSVDLSRVQRQLMLVPSIQSASVIRRPPSEIQLRISERVPVAQVCLYRTTGPEQLLESHVLYLDAEGYVMPHISGSTQSLTQLSKHPLASLVGLRATDAPIGQRITLPQARAALKWVVEFDKTPLSSLVEVCSIDVGNPQTLRVTTEQGSEIIFATQNLESQLQRWQTVHEWGAKNLKVIGSLDLAVQNYVPLRWLDSTPTLPSKTKQNSPLLPRKKHV